MTQYDWCDCVSDTEWHCVTRFNEHRTMYVAMKTFKLNTLSGHILGTLPVKVDAYTIRSINLHGNMFLEFMNTSEIGDKERNSFVPTIIQTVRQVWNNNGWPHANQNTSLWPLHLLFKFDTGWDFTTDNFTRQNHLLFFMGGLASCRELFIILGYYFIHFLYTAGGQIHRAAKKQKNYSL